jgi:hypothetical protein
MADGESTEMADASIKDADIETSVDYEDLAAEITETYEKAMQQARAPKEKEYRP